MREPTATSKPQHTCPVEAVVDVIGGRWKTGILYNLLQRPHRFGELRRALGPVTEKVLMQQLRELESHGVVHREVYPEVPPRVEYSLTTYGRTLGPALEALRQWGEQHLQRLRAADPVDRPFTSCACWHDGPRATRHLAERASS